MRDLNRIVRSLAYVLELCAFRTFFDCCVNIFYGIFCT